MFAILFFNAIFCTCSKWVFRFLLQDELMCLSDSRRIDWSTHWLIYTICMQIRIFNPARCLGPVRLAINLVVEPWHSFPRKQRGFLKQRNENGASWKRCLQMVFSRDAVQGDHLKYFGEGGIIKEGFLLNQRRGRNICRGILKRNPTKVILKEVIEQNQKDGLKTEFQLLN